MICISPDSIYEYILNYFQMLDVNMKASFFLIKEAVPYMEKRGYARTFKFSNKDKQINTYNPILKF